MERLFARTRRSSGSRTASAGGIESVFELLCVDQEKVAMALVKIADDLEIERIQLGHRWEREVTELTDRFKIANAHTPDYGRFMLDALATRGRDAYPEVVTVAQGLRLPIPVVSNEKIAELAVRRVVSDSPELKLLERAVETRFAYVR